MRNFRWSVADAVLNWRKQRSQPPSRIIVGLGNPGSEYAQTRHNVGFWCVDRIAANHDITLSRRHRSALIGEGVIEGHRIVLAKPRTFVNRSGLAVAYLITRYGVTPQELLVIYDDISLPPEKVRLRPEGSAGGHNGVTSIIDAVGTQDFPRLRIGLGGPPDGVGRVEDVLGTMSHEERKAALELVERAAEATVSLLTDGIDEAMGKFN